ncbi:peptidoglycan DD-metalloendopeptidase family protein [Aquamicrobium sp. LC103]|uniref:peptidoglycan DD-metalloendopeptidase family protein n=1 Tax=Aquamicrobium sp. LC103 TaxID=1120658 RepID=UPI000AFF2BA5|nr:peptidoglycan DD-metalloendopeptidase family protein [Aquamicrobium sp. LC103]
MTQTASALLSNPVFSLEALGPHAAGELDLSARPDAVLARLADIARGTAAESRVGRMDPVVARALLRKGAGLEPVPGGRALREWIAANAGSWHGILKPSVRDIPTTILELGGAAAEIAAASAMQDRETAQTKYDALMAAEGARLGIGTWHEYRTVYSTDAYVSVFDPSVRRDHHLGIDLFCDAGTALVLPMDGEVVDARIIDARLDYGGVLVLEHEFAEGRKFWSLWGHLSHASARAWKPGDRIAAGTTFCDMGDFEENGWWLPHLHFQLSAEKYPDFGMMPGVGEGAFLSIWTDLFPDPTPLIFK